MPQYDQALNTDVNNKLTSSEHDGTKWVQNVKASDLEQRLGEATASPTANTVLARLKNLESYVDGLEAALGTTTDAEATGNGSLIAIVKRLRTALGEVQADPTANTVLARLKALEGYVDGLEAVLGTTADAIVAADAAGSVSAKLRRLTADLNALLARIGEVQASPTANTQLARLKNVEDYLGATADVVVAAGATGSLSAKIRRLTTDLDALLARLGEVQASPSANTLLARLKDIKDGIPLTGSTVPSAVTMQNAAAANGNGTSLTVTGLGTAVLTVSGTFVATVNFESSNDGGATWFPHLATKMGDGSIANTTTTTGQYRLNVAGVDLVRARISGYTSGNVTVIGKSSAIVAPSKAIQTSQAQKDIIARATDNIIDTIGAENINLFLPMWETSGTKLYDLLRRDLTFTVSGATLAQSGPFGNCLSFDGVDDYVQQDAVPDAEHNTDTATQELQATTAVAVQKLKVIATNPGFVRLRLIKKGAPNGSVKVEIRTAKDGAAITNGTSALLACSEMGTSAQSRGFTFATPPNLQKNTVYYLALVYDGNTNADASHNIGWRYDGAGSYGQGRHYYDGAGWTDTATEDHRFGVWGNALVIGDDYTLITVAMNSATSLATRSLMNLPSMISTDRLAIARWSSVGTLSFQAHDSTYRNALIYRWPISTTHVFAGTFSKTKSTGKINYYLDGLLGASVDGTGATGQTMLAQPLTLGATIQVTGGLTERFQGTAGPFIWTKSELTAAQVGKISHNLLALRKFQVEV